MELHTVSIANLIALSYNHFKRSEGMARRINGILVSHDYDELMRELASDIVEFNLDKIGIVRGEEQYGYRPIIDYYTPTFFDEVEEEIEIVNAQAVIAEMLELNSII